MGSRGTRYSTAQSGPSGDPYHTAVAGSSDSTVAGSGSTQSVSLAPPTWAARVFGGRAGHYNTDGDAQQGNVGAAAGACDDDEAAAVAALRESSVIVRRVVPPTMLSDNDGTPFAQALHLVGPALRSPSTADSPERVARESRAAAAGAATPESAPPAWEFPRLSQQPLQAPAAMAAAPAPLAQALPAQVLPPAQQPQAHAQLRIPTRHQMQSQEAEQQQAPQWPPQQPALDPALRYAAPPPPVAQQPLPPGRYGWQRVPNLPEPSTTTADSASLPFPAFGRAEEGGAFRGAGAPSVHASRDIWPGSVAGGGEPAAGAPHDPRPMQPPSAASSTMHRGPSWQGSEGLLPAQEALYGRPGVVQPGVVAGSGGGEGTRGPYHPSSGKPSPSKASLESSAFRVEAFAGAAATAPAGGGGGGDQPGQRPSRTAGLRKRHAAQLRRQDRDQYGVPVASSARPFSLWAPPHAIGEACTGLGVYFVSVKQFIIAALLLSLVAIYPLCSNLTSQRWADSYMLVVGQEPVLQCSKGWDTSSWVTGSTAGSRCASSRYSSSFDCPSRCTWHASRLSPKAGGQCAGLPSPLLPTSAAASGGANASCLLHPPCSAGGSADPTAPDGPCYCCQLELDEELVPAPAAGAGPVPAAQLWVLLVGQLAFLVWVLLLTKAQLHAVHSADARVITASDYTVRLQGVPRSVTAAELREWCSHYGSVVAAFHVPDVGDALHVAQRLHALQIKCAESDAWLASPGCCAGACWFRAAALGAASRARLARAAEDAARELRCYQRQELRPTGAALVVFEYAEHAANCIEDHHRSAARRAADALLCGTTASAPRLASTRIHVDRAPEPSDVLWEHTACTGSAAVWRRLWSGALTLLIVAVGAGVQYGLAVAGEQERKRRLSQLYRYQPHSDYTFDFSSWAAFTASALEVTKLNAISILSGLAVVVVNWLVTVAVRQLAVLERWHTRTAGERWALLKLSVAYLVNSFVVPLLAAYFAGSSDSWYSRGGLMESAFYMQLANALLPPLAVLCDLQELLYFQVLSRMAKTQAMVDRLLAPPPFLLAEQYASALTTLGLALFWMPVLPVSPMLAALGLFWAYWTDKIVALRRCAHPGNMRGKLVSSADLIIRVLPLVQLLLMRFVFFVGEGAMTAVFWTGLAIWLLFAMAPIRALLGLVPRRRSTVTGGLSYQETLGKGQRKGMDDRYEPEVPPCCSATYHEQVASAFAPLPAPTPATEALLPRQNPATGGAATRPPFRPDRSSERAVARAAGMLRTRQQAVLSSVASTGLGRTSSGAAAGGAGLAAGAGAEAVAASASGPSVEPPGQGAQRVEHQRHSSGGGSRLGRTLSAVKGGLASGAHWLWNTPDPDNLFSYDWKQAHEEGDTQTTASAPPLPLYQPGSSGMYSSAAGSGRGWGSGSPGQP